MFDDQEQARLRQLYSGKGIGHYRVQCPFCIQGRKNKSEKTLSLEVTGVMMLARCHHCERDGIILPERKRVYEPVILDIPKKPNVLKSIREGLSEEGKAFLAQRGISEQTAKEAGCVSAVAYFPSLETSTEALAFVHRGGLYKLRSIVEKSHVCTGKLERFYGEIANEPLVITEGEIDRLSCMEAGIKNVVSVPNGASASKSEDAMEYLWSSKDDLEKITKIIVAVDGDKPGEDLGEEISRRLGKHRCWKVAYPEGCKDANDVLTKHGKDSLADLIKNATAWPVAGLYEATTFKDAMYSLYKGTGGLRVSTGYPTLDRLYSVSPGLLTVLTGIPGSGKSTFIDQLMINLSDSEEWVHGVCSFENSPPSMHLGKLLQMKLGKHFFSDQIGLRMSEMEIETAFPWINEHFKFITQANGETMPIETILENARIAVMRWGLKSLVIDPYNYITRPKNLDSEVKWIGDILAQARLFAASYGVHVWFVAHPTKLRENEDGTTRPPVGYDISGCYSEDTEVLTTQGWVPHPRITLDHEVACFDLASDELSYQKPTKVHVYPHCGDMHHWVGRGIDSLVTPNHRMVLKPAYVWPAAKNPRQAQVVRPQAWQFIKSEEMPAVRWHVPLSGHMKHGDGGGLIPMDGGYDSIPFWWYVGFWLAEGCEQSCGLSVCQAEDNSYQPRQVMQTLGLNFYETVKSGRDGERPIWNARIYKRSHPEMTKWILAECGKGCASKRFPKTIWSASRQEKGSLLDGLLFGDGSEMVSGTRFTTTSKGLADDVHRLAVELGYWVHATCYVYKKEKRLPQWVVTIHKNIGRCIEPSRNRKTVPYEGTVYCLTVPTGAYVTRRNGKTLICGNSAEWFNKPDFGLTVHRFPGDNMTRVICWKRRFEWLGKEGSANLIYQEPRHRYFEEFEGYKPWQD